MTTPGLPVSRPYISAMIDPTCSWRTSTVSILVESYSASKIRPVSPPGMPNTNRMPASSRTCTTAWGTSISSGIMDLSLSDMLTCGHISCSKTASLESRPVPDGRRVDRGTRSGYISSRSACRRISVGGQTVPWWNRLMRGFEPGDEPGLMSQIGPLAGVHVLIVDDNRDARDLLQMVLVADGATVTTCDSAWDALQAVHRDVPAVLVSDVVMPRENAFWLIREIRKLPPLRGGNIPALAVTAYSALFTAPQALAAGFDAFLERPVERWELCRVVAMLAGRGGRDESQHDRRAG